MTLARLLIGYVSLALVSGCISSSLQAQELRAEVEIHAEQVATTLSQGFLSSLQRQLSDLINRTRWTGLAYAPQERIEARFSLHLTGQTERGDWQGELVISARRPVYHSDYKSTTFLVRDREVTFSYQQGAPLQHQGQAVEHPLVALIAYYCYYLIANDLDSFSPLGGNELISELQHVVQEARAHTDWTGWESIGRQSPRISLMERYDLPEEASFRQVWYRYHREGLDHLADSPEKAREAIQACLEELQTFQRTRFQSPSLDQLREVKVSELIALYRQAPAEQRRVVSDLLSQLFPEAQERLRTLLPAVV